MVLLASSLYTLYLLVRLLYLYILLPSISYTTPFIPHHRAPFLPSPYSYSCARMPAYLPTSPVLTTSFSGMDNVLCCDSTPLVLIVDVVVIRLLYCIAYIFYCYYIVFTLHMYILYFWLYIFNEFKRLTQAQNITHLLQGNTLT